MCAVGYNSIILSYIGRHFQDESKNVLNNNLCKIIFFPTSSWKVSYIKAIFKGNISAYKVRELSVRREDHSEHKFQIFLYSSSLQLDCPWKYCIQFSLTTQRNQLQIPTLLFHIHAHFHILQLKLCLKKLGHYSFFFVPTQQKMMITSSSGMKWGTFKTTQLESPEKDSNTLCSQHFCGCIIARNKSSMNYLPRNIELAWERCWK